MLDKRVTIVFIFFFAVAQAFACPRLIPSFTVSYSNTCGTPRLATITNTTTGADSAVSTYRYYVDGQIFDTQLGVNGTSVLLTGTGVKRISMLVTDTAGCIDSSFTTVTITTTAAQIRDQNLALSYAPTWINCIQLSNAPDSFEVTLSSNDTLSDPIIIWGDGTQDIYNTSQNPNTNFSHWYSTTGIFTLRIVQRQGTCTDTIYGTVSNLRQPTAGVVGPRSGNNSGCVPHTVTMTNNSSNISPGTTFTWEWGDGLNSFQGDTQSSDSISHTYLTNLCNGNVRLTATNACGSSFTTWNPINISDVDLAAFSIDSSNCDPTNSFTFTNNTSDRYCLVPDFKEYYWDWGDGTNTGWITSAGPQTHSYANEGPITVMLIARNSCGDDTITQTFNVVYPPEVGFLFDSTGGCEQARIFVDDTSSGFNNTRLWDFGDGTTSTADTVTHFYTTPGTYTLSLSVTNRCGTETIDRTIIVYNLPEAAFNDTAGGCAPHTINPANLSSSDFATSNYLWDFGNGNTSVNFNPGLISYNISGSYNLKLTITDLCGTDSLEATIVVDTTPTALVTTDTSICAFQSLLFNNLSSQFTSLTTQFGDGNADTQTTNGNFSYTYSTPGLYTVVHTALSGNGCESRDTNIVLVRPSAQAQFTVNDTQACAPFVFTFTNTSLLANEFRWYINDSLVSNNQSLPNINVQMDSSLLRVKLWALDSSSCFADSIEQEVFTSRNPIASFNSTVDSSCAPLLDSLDNTSQFANSYIWNFGNGTTSTLDNPNSTWLASSFQDTVYDLSLRAINWLGCEDTAIGARKIFPNPSTSFSMSDTFGCGPLGVSFINNSIPNDTGNIGVMTFNWDFGNGNQSVLVNDSQTFLSNSLRDTTYRISLTGTSEHGCIDIDSSIIRVYPNPTVSFASSINNGCGPLLVEFNNSSVPNDTGSIDIMSFSWDFGNGVNRTNVNDTQTYTASLTQDTIYPIQLIAETEHGCVDSAQDTIRVYPKPNVLFNMSADSGCAPLPITFTNVSVPFDTGSIRIMTFNWDFGNVVISQAQDTSVGFLDRPLTDTIYQIQLIGASEHGCLDTAIREVKVHPKPFPFFSASVFSGCGPLEIDFTSTSSLAEELYWDFGNGFNLGNTIETQTFQSADLVDSLYNVRLYVVSNRNCRSDDTFSLPIVVRANPIANFEISDDSICVEQLSLFYNLSQGANRFKWYFGTGDSSTRYNPIYNFPPNNPPNVANQYSIKLEAENFFGCLDSIRRELYVFPRVVAQFTVDEDSACAPLEVNFTNSSLNANTHFWEFGDGDTSSVLNPIHTFDNFSNNNITYRTVLRSSNEFGCVDYDSLNLTAIPVPFADFAAVRIDICDSGYFDFVNRSVNGTNFLWDFGDGTTDTGANPRHLFRRSIYNDTSYTVTLTASNFFGCSQQISREVTLPVRMVPSFDTFPIQRVCQPANITFNNTTSNSLYQVWHFGDGGISTQFNGNYNYIVPGIYGAKLVAYDQNSCPDSFESFASVEVLEKPRANFSYNPASPKAPNALVNFTNLSEPQGLNYNWDFGDGNNSLLEDPTNLYVDSGLYNVSLVVNNGLCADTISKPLYIEPPFPTVDFTVNDSEGCAPLTVQFQQNTINATSFRWTFDDGVQSTLANPAHTFTIPGYYNITLRATGPGGTSFLVKDSMIRIYPNPVASFAPSPRTRYLPNAIFNLFDGSGGAVNWQYLVSHDSLPQYVYTFNEANPQFELPVSGYYTVRQIVENQFGCADTSERLALLYVASEGRVIVPNAFTPNADDNNDFFKPILTGVLEEGYRFQVFDRWGIKLFETTNQEEAWNGMYMNKPAVMDAYIWLVNGRFADGTVFEEKGNVTLLR